MIDAITQILAGFVGSIGFGVLFNVRGKKLLMASLGGLVSWGLFLILSVFINNEPLNYFIVALLMSVYAEFMARKLKSPTTCFITISLIPLIPGGSLYYTMAYAFQSDIEKFAGKGIYTLSLAAALALGVIVSTTVTKVLNNKKRKS
ncbi:MAG: threonine/serine exporter family protein [Acutalibacteraceae bacterium]|mgnify:CR=1 FL=1|nr:threonine/serine exporter family protein [Acutalibacteraceae bacterium]